MKQTITVNGIAYLAGTPDGVVKALEYALKQDIRVHVHSGDPETGADFHEEVRVYGYVRLSSGPTKSPLLIPTSRSDGGGLIITNGVVKITATKNGLVLYQHPTYRAATFVVRSDSDVPELPFATYVNGKRQTRHPSEDSARRYVAKVGGILQMEIAQPA